MLQVSAKKTSPQYQQWDKQIKSTTKQSQKHIVQKGTDHACPRCIELHDKDKNTGGSQKNGNQHTSCARLCFAGRPSFTLSCFCAAGATCLLGCRFFAARCHKNTPLLFIFCFTATNPTQMRDLVSVANSIVILITLYWKFFFPLFDDRKPNMLGNLQ